MNGMSRPRLFGAVLLLCTAGALGYAAHVALGRQAALARSADDAALAPSAQPAPAAAAQGQRVGEGVTPSATSITAIPPLAAGSAAPRLLYRSTAPGDSYGSVMLASLAAASEPPDSAAPSARRTPLRCERVHFAAGRGLCLQAKRGVLTTYTARLFNAAFETTGSYALAGPPSRARVSPDGRLAAMTVFVAGHGYSSGDFTTRTSVIDAHTGRPLVDDLESFAVTKDGMPFKESNFNFWGVTFARDAQRFYATLGSGQRRWLVEGDLAARRMRVIHEAVECPSLSPDNRRIAFKRRIAGEAGGRIVWQLQVLDLASGQETALRRETRNVDDQVEWLDDAHLAYALPDDPAQAGAASSTWSLAADGSADPQRLWPYAFSPTVLRGP